MTMVVLLLPWFVVHGAQMPPAHALIAPQLLAAIGAALLILVVTRLRRGPAAPGHLLDSGCAGALSLWRRPVFRHSVRFFHQARDPSARPHVLRAAAGLQIGQIVPADETVAVFRVRRDIEYGLSFYRNHEVVNYDESGVPDEEHILVVRAYGRHGADLHTQADLEEYLEGRQYEQLFTWPEQGLEIYLVGSR